MAVTAAPKNASPRTNTRRPRVPWLWVEITRKAPGAPLLPAILLGLGVYGLSLLYAAWYHDVTGLLRDPFWPFIPALTATGALTMALTPPAVARLSANMAPWLAEPRSAASLARESERLVARIFWPIVALRLAGQVAYTLLPPADVTGLPFSNRHPLINLLPGIVFVYFFGGSAAIGTFGLGILARHLSRMELKRGFILGDGKATLQPFNQMLWMVWGTFALPVVAGSALALRVASASGEPLRMVDLLSTGIALFLLVPTIVGPQLWMNRLLAKAKARELRSLREEMKVTADTSGLTEPSELLRRIVRQQQLVHDIQQVQSFTPTLVDVRLVLQIGTSASASLLGTVLLRTIVDRII